MDLFDNESPDDADAGGAPISGAADGENARAPLADRMRPRTLDEFFGQEEIVGEGAPLRRLIEGDSLRSMIFWGPPGTGKTTLATIIARQTRSEYLSLSAVTASIKDAKAIMQRARLFFRNQGRRTVLFIDEIHRFNKAQQDAFLPFVEDGSIILVGATTENPSFSVIAALMSRCKIFVLKALGGDHLVRILEAALTDSERGLGGGGIEMGEGVLEQIASLADGDGRRALNLLELAVQLTEETVGVSDGGAVVDDAQPGEGAPVPGATKVIDMECLRAVLQRQQLFYDKTGEEHFNIISALHKSMRGSDPQAALYWAERMLASGEDPLYVARRMIRFATEDIGNADPQALSVALAAREAFALLGSPEGNLALLQCVAYLATAPKSNAIYVAEASLKAEIEATGSLPVPFHIRNAPTAFMKGLGYGSGYQYDHDSENRFAGQEHLPDGVKQRVFYDPPEIGFEREIRKRMEWWEKRRKGGE